MVPKADVGDEFLSGKMMLSSWNDMGVDGSYLFYKNISKYNCIISCNISISCLLNVCFLFAIKLKYTYEYISFSRLSIQCCMISHIMNAIIIYRCLSYIWICDTCRLFWPTAWYPKVSPRQKMRKISDDDVPWRFHWISLDRCGVAYAGGWLWNSSKCSNWSGLGRMFFYFYILLLFLL